MFYHTGRPVVKLESACNYKVLRRPIGARAPGASHSARDVKNIPFMESIQVLPGIGSLELCEADLVAFDGDRPSGLARRYAVFL